TQRLVRETKPMVLWAVRVEMTGVSGRRGGLPERTQHQFRAAPFGSERLLDLAGFPERIQRRGRACSLPTPARRPRTNPAVGGAAARPPYRRGDCRWRPGPG